MKTKIYFSTLLLFFITLGFASCSDNDNEERTEISELAGTWELFHDDPRITTDNIIKYTFDGDNKCDIYNYDLLYNRDTIIYRTYKLNNELITLYEEGFDYSLQYNITKLTSKEMIWRNAQPASSFAYQLKFKKIKPYGNE